MEDMMSQHMIWASAMVGGILGLLVLVKAPEFMVAGLLVGQDFVQFAMTLVGFHITRRTFAQAGAVIFIPVVVLFIIMRMLHMREDQPLIGRRNIMWVMLTVVMGIILIIGLTYTEAGFYGAKKTEEYFVFGFAPMMLVFVFVRDAASVRRLIFWIALLCCAMITLVSVYSLATRGSLQGTLMFLTRSGGEEVGGMEITGHGALSSDVVYLLAICLALAAAHTSGKWKLLPILALPITAFYILRAGTRSNLLAFLAIAIIGFFLAYRDRLGVFLVALLFLALLAGIFVATADSEIQERMLSSWIAEGTIAGGGGHTRVEILMLAPGQIAQAPLFGHGTGGWVMLTHGMDVYDYPHNMFVEMFIENGAIGFGILIGIWGFVAVRVVHCLRAAPVGSWLYGVGVLGVCILFVELFSAGAHFGLAHHSCTLLISSAVIMRSSVLIEAEDREQLEAAEVEETEPLVARV